MVCFSCTICSVICQFMFMLYCFVNCNECDQANHYLVVISVRTVVMICTVSFCFKGELGLLKWKDICMCDVHKQFELPDFRFSRLCLPKV